VKRIASSHDDLSVLLINVRNDVMRETQNKQIPWEHSALTGRFYFNAPAPDHPAAPLMPARSSEAAEAWTLVKDTTDVRALEAFRRQYGAANAFFDRLGELRAVLVRGLPLRSLDLYPAAVRARPIGRIAPLCDNSL